MGKTIVGLEVTEESVRAAEVRSAARRNWSAYGEVPLAPEAAKDSEVLDPGAVAVALRQLWTGARFKSKDVVLGRGEPPHPRSRVHDAGDAPGSAARGAALPGAGSASGAREPGRARLLSAAAARRPGVRPARRSRHREHRADHRHAVAGEAARPGRRSHALSGSRASRRASRPADATVATVFIGDHTTQVVVARGGIPQFVRLLPIDVPTSATQGTSATDRARPCSRPSSTPLPRPRASRGAHAVGGAARRRAISPPGCAAPWRSSRAGRPRTRSRRCSSPVRASRSRACMPALEAAIDSPPQRSSPQPTSSP